MDLPLLLAMVILLALSSFFSASETAFNTASRTRLKTMAQDHNKRAKLVLKLTDQYSKLISTILVGNNIVNISLSSIATLFFIDLLKGNESVATAVSTAVITVAVLIFGEVSPKTIAKESPEKFAMFAAGVMNVLMIVLTPINFLFDCWNKMLLKLFRIKGEQTVTEEDLITIVDEAETGGEIDKDESQMIRSAIEFNELDVQDVLTPRVDVVAVDIGDTVEEIHDSFRKSGYSRLPVYKGTIDNILGVINQKDFYEKVIIGKKKTKFVVSPVKFVTPFSKISDVMKILQKSKSHMAVVVDEYGGTQGIITLEDIIEELVGEIWDEHDEINEELTELEENQYKVAGSYSTAKLFALLDVEEDPDEELPATVAGLVMKMKESIPQVGEEIQYKELTIRVLELDASRIEQLLVIYEPPAEEE